MVGYLRQALAIGCFLLAGCTGTTPPGDGADSGSPAEPAPAAAFPVVLAQGRQPFHAREPIGYDYMVFQSAAGFCYNTDSNEVMPWMFHLSDRYDILPTPEGTTALEFTASWTAQDYAGDGLRFAARPPGSEEYLLYDVLSGQPTSVPLASDLHIAGDWDFWLCTKQAVPDADPRVRTSAPFVGEVDILLQAIG